MYRLVRSGRGTARVGAVRGLSVSCVCRLWDYLYWLSVSALGPGLFPSDSMSNDIIWSRDWLPDNFCSTTCAIPLVQLYFISPHSNCQSPIKKPKHLDKTIKITVTHKRYFQYKIQTPLTEKPPPKKSQIPSFHFISSSLSKAYFRRCDSEEKGWRRTKRPFMRRIFMIGVNWMFSCNTSVSASDTNWLPCLIRFNMSVSANSLLSLCLCVDDLPAENV